ncbi:MAG TPA: S8 family serine peptidase, partial [Hymenobacter sp.]|nr:S8 family serine peptidase [Hymenobacter sp.]
SSRGPVWDGRLKPEITAMGQGVISSWPFNTYSPNNGTSMSAPAVSGGLALLYQRYRQLHGGADPKNGLLKAILCNGALDQGAAGPDFQNGFGWMNLLRSVEMLDANRYFSGNSIPGGTITHSIGVPANTARLNVLLYWNDLPASVVSNKTLVNDLDLEVVDPTGAVVLPKILDTAMSALGNVAVNGVDRVNNIEQVVINSPVAGTYTIRVKGTTVTNSRQEYFVVYDPLPVGLKVTAPAGGEALVPGESTKIVWESNGLTGTATLEFSQDGGTTWSVVASGLDINRLFYSWTVPAASTGNGIVRITGTGGGRTAGSAPFTILGQPVVSLAPVQCEDYIALDWTPVDGATGYEVMLLRGNEMKPVATTTSTSFLFTGLSKDSTYFVTVRAIKGGKAGRRGVAVSRKPDTGNCTGPISDNDVKLDALLSPTSGRKATATALGSAEIVRVRIRNLDDNPVSNLTVSYTVNGSTPVTETINTPLAAGAMYEHTFSTPVNLFQTGLYTLKTFVKNSGDLNPANDTATSLIRHLANEPLVLNAFFSDNLEGAAPATYEKDTVGLAGIERYDFTRSTPWGRLRTYFQTGIAASGSKAITIDANRYHAAGNTNYLLGTFNLAN